MPGLYDNEIYTMMKKYKHFVGVISRDEIDLIKPYLEKYKYVGFIINLDTSDKGGSHWNAILIDYRPTGSHSIEYYDSFGRKCPNDIKNDLKKIVDSDLTLKFKENLIKRQSYHTHACGKFAVFFLIKRFNGKSFKESSNATEKDIRHLPIFKFF